MSLRATRPPVTSKAPAPSANSEAVPVPPVLGSSGAFAGAGGGGGGGGGGAALGGGGGGGGSHGALATTPPAFASIIPSLHSASALAPPASATLALASATTAGSSWASAGAAAIIATASIAASIINFLNTYLLLKDCFRRRRTPTRKGVRLPTKLTLCYVLASLSSCRSRLVDLLVTRGGVGRARGDRATNLFELKVIDRRGVLEDVDLVLRVASLAYTLDPRTLVGVGAPTSNIERLIDLAAIGFLLLILLDLSYGRNGRDDHHRQQRRQQHQLLQLLTPLRETSMTPGILSSIITTVNARDTIFSTYLKKP